MALWALSAAEWSNEPWWVKYLDFISNITIFDKVQQFNTMEKLVDIFQLHVI